MITRIAWCAAAAAGLSRALPPQTLELVAREVIGGISLLWECSHEQHHAYCVTRVDVNPPTLVIVAFEGTGMMHFGPLFIAAARSRGLPLRAHTVNKFVVRLVRKLGFELKEFVVRAAA